MKTPETKSDALTFLQMIHAGADGYIEFRILGGAKPRKRFFHELPLKALPELPNNRDCYFGVCPRTREEGTAEAVEVATCLWMDVDYAKCGGIDGAKGARHRLRDGKLVPSAIVNTGHGEHWYWLLKTPMPFHKISPLLERMRMFIDPNLDPVSDAPRILRVPGTWNCKQDERLEVEVRRCRPGQRYELSDFKVLPKVKKEDKPRTDTQKDDHNAASVLFGGVPDGVFRPGACANSRPTRPPSLSRNSSPASGRTPSSITAPSPTAASRNLRSTPNSESAVQSRGLRHVVVLGCHSTGSRASRPVERCPTKRSSRRRRRC